MGRQEAVDFIDMPQAIRGKYQYHTQAEMARLLAAAGDLRFTPLQDAVADYIQNYLVPGKTY
jgi:ADP-L-glycero-D-manno-heptose 6-epimerase